MQRFLLSLFLFIGIASCNLVTLVDYSKNSFSVVATKGDFDDRIKLTWNRMPVYKGYEVLKSRGEFETYEPISNIINNKTFEDFDVEVGVTYYYKIRAYNDLHMPVFTTQIAKGYAGSAGGFYPPSNIRIALGVSSKKLTLTWDRVADASAYEIWRSHDNERFNIIGKVSILHFEDSNDLCENHVYYYQISCIDKDGIPSPDRSPSVAGSLFGGDIQLTTHLGKFTDRIRLEWMSLAYVTQYRIFRSEKEHILGAEIAVIAQHERKVYEDLTVLPNQIYYYTILAENNSAQYLSRQEMNYLKTLDAPTKPLNFHVSQGLHPDKIHLSWDAIPNALQYFVYRAQSESGPWSKICEITDCHYQDLIPNHAYFYYYKVVGFKGSLGEASDIKEGWANRPPVNIKASNDLGRKIILKWDSISHAEKYLIQRSEVQNGPFKDIDVVNTNAYSDSIDIGNIPSKCFYYKIAVISQGTKSAYSLPVRGEVKKMEAPTNLHVNGHNTPTQTIQLIWDRMDNVKEYHIYQATLSHMGAKVEKLKSTDFKLIGVSSNASYQISFNSYPIRRHVYQVRAVDYGMTEGLGVNTDIVWRLPVDIEDFVRDVDCTIVEAQAQIPNLGRLGAKERIQARLKGNYFHEASIWSTKNEWNDYTSFEISLQGSPKISINASSMSASMTGSITISGLYQGTLTYNGLLGKEGAISTGGSITATYKHPSGDLTKTWSCSEAAGILKSVILSADQKPSSPHFDEGSGV